MYLQGFLVLLWSLCGYYRYSVMLLSFFVIASYFTLFLFSLIYFVLEIIKLKLSNEKNFSRFWRPSHFKRWKFTLSLYFL
uniref:Putative ovule protein n=1 Tax=Solanum chacoense TaxID=4108 RepID=A0A0V0HSN3_SOLCH